MTVTELESMVVRLLGDGSAYMKMMKDAETSTRQGMETVKQAATQIESHQKQLEGFANSAVKALSMVGLGMGMKSMLNSFTEAETGMLRLKASIAANGGRVELVTEDYKKFAQGIADSTMATKEQVYATLLQAETMGKTGQAAKELTTIAVAFQAVKGGEVQHWVHAAEAMQTGNVQMLKHMLHMRGVKDESEIMSRAQKMVTAGLEIAEKQANSAAGALNQLQKAGASVAVELGGMIAEAVLPVIRALQEAVMWWKGLDKETKTAVMSIAAVTVAFKTLGPMLHMVRALLSPVSLAMTAIGVLLGTWINDVGGIGEAWKRVGDWIRDTVQYLEFVFRHFGEYVALVWNQIQQGALYVGMLIEQVFTGTVSGASLNAMKTLEAEANAMIGRLGQSYADFRKQKADEAVKAAEKTGMKIGEALAAGGHKELHKFDAALAGSTEAAGRIAEFQNRIAGGGPSSPLEQAADALKDSAAAMKASHKEASSGFKFITDVWDQFWKDASVAWNNWVKGLQFAWQSLVKFITDGVQGIGKLFEVVVKGWGFIITTMWEGVVRFVKEGFMVVWDILNPSGALERARADAEESKRQLDKTRIPGSNLTYGEIKDLERLERKAATEEMFRKFGYKNAEGETALNKERTAELGRMLKEISEKYTVKNLGSIALWESIFPKYPMEKEKLSNEDFELGVLGRVMKERPWLGEVGNKTQGDLVRNLSVLGEVLDRIARRQGVVLEPAEVE